MRIPVEGNRRSGTVTASCKTLTDWRLARNRDVHGLGLLGDAFDLWPIAVPALILSIWMIFFAARCRCLPACCHFAASIFGASSWVRTARCGADYSRRFPDDGRAKNARLLFFNVAFFVVLVAAPAGTSLSWSGEKGKVVVRTPVTAVVSRVGLDIHPDNPWGAIHLSVERRQMIASARRCATCICRAETHIAALFRNNELFHPPALACSGEGDVPACDWPGARFTALGKLFK